MTTKVRVAVIADYLEEHWPSMDLVADMLMTHFATEHAGSVEATLIRPAMPRWIGGPGEDAPPTLDRMASRLLHYPRVLRKIHDAFDVYHVVDHSYAHLVHALPAGRTLVTCHDLDAFRSILEPEEERRPFAYRMIARRILAGLRSAAHVACDSEATRTALVKLANFPEDRLSVIPNGADTGGHPQGDTAADVEAARILGPRRGIELLHVGSTIPRKRIDVLLEVFAAVRRSRGEVVGSPGTELEFAL